jgi:GNAT superfamily N-acetyltransferase
MGNSSLQRLCLRQPSSPSVGNSLQPFEAFAAMNSSQPALANAVLSSTTFFQLLHNKNLMWDGFQPPHKSKLCELGNYCVMIKITKMSPIYSNQLQSLSVNEDQKKFVGTVSDALAATTEQVHLHLILAEELVVGVFLIDLNYPEKYEFAPLNSLGLRAYMIDSHYQGKGFGTTAIKLLPEYLKENYAEYRDIFLTVNCQNPVARQCYLKGGFLDTEQLYFGGAAGPQHIMKLAIK